MHLLRSVMWRWLATVIIGGGLLAGGVWYGLTSERTGGVFAQEAPSAPPTVATPPTVPTPTVPTRAQPAASPVRESAQGAPKPSQSKPQAKTQAGPQATPQAKPQNANARRPTGEVVSISQEPAGLTMQTATGEHLTFRVLQTTVFAAGRDRPYRFELLKVGDQVTVVIGGQGQQQAQKPRAAARNAQANGEIVARQVLVRPAAEVARPGGGPGARKGQGQRQNAGVQPKPGQPPAPQTSVQPQNAQSDGGTNGTGQ
jgi:hypothetical protein